MVYMLFGCCSYGLGVCARRYQSSYISSSSSNFFYIQKNENIIHQKRAWHTSEVVLNDPVRRMRFDLITISMYSYEETGLEGKVK
jgi:hypothetical protein